MLAILCLKAGVVLRCVSEAAMLCVMGEPAEFVVTDALKMNVVGRA
jgi:hypothetical protein